MISAGYPHQNGRYVEIIDLIDPYSKCEFVKEWDKKPKDVGGQKTVG